MRNLVQPDIMAKLYLYPPEMKGRKSPTLVTFYSFRIKVDDSFHDARALLNEHSSLVPGARVNVPVKFLDSQVVLSVRAFMDRIKKMR